MKANHFRHSGHGVTITVGFSGPADATNWTAFSPPNRKAVPFFLNLRAVVDVVRLM